MGRKASTAEKTATILSLFFLMVFFWKICMYPFRAASAFKKFLGGTGTLLLASGALLGLLYGLGHFGYGLEASGVREWIHHLLLAGGVLYGGALLWMLTDKWTAKSPVVDSSPVAYVRAGGNNTGFLYEKAPKTCVSEPASIPEVPVVMASSVPAEPPERPGFDMVVVNHLLYPDWAELPACAKKMTFSNRGGSGLCLNPIYPWANREKIADDISEMTGNCYEADNLGTSVYIGRVTASAQEHLEELQEYFAKLHCELHLVKPLRYQGLTDDERKELQKEGYTFAKWTGWRRKGKFKCGACLHEWLASVPAPESCPECRVDDWKQGFILRCEICLHEWNYSEMGAGECPLCGTAHDTVKEG